MPAASASVPEAGDVLWIDFGPPFGHEQAGRRPALVLTSHDYNTKSSILIVCPITRTERAWPFAVALPPLGLLSGFVLVDQIKAVDPAARLLRFAGQVSTETLNEVRRRLASLLDVPPRS